MFQLGSSVLVIGSCVFRVDRGQLCLTFESENTLQFYSTLFKMNPSYAISQSKTKHIKTAQYSLLERSVRIIREQPPNANSASPPPSPGADKSVFVEVVDKAINETMALAKTPVLRIGATIAVPDSTCEELTVPFASSKQNVINSLVKEFEHQSESDITGSSDEESENGSNGAWSIASTGLEKLEITVKLFMEPL